MTRRLFPVKFSVTCASCDKQRLLKTTDLLEVLRLYVLPAAPYQPPPLRPPEPCPCGSHLVSKIELLAETL